MVWDDGHVQPGLNHRLDKIASEQDYALVTTAEGARLSAIDGWRPFRLAFPVVFVVPLTRVIAFPALPTEFTIMFEFTVSPAVRITMVLIAVKSRHV
jgi:hypothetical protein